MTPALYRSLPEAPLCEFPIAISMIPYKAADPHVSRAGAPLPMST
jgi:hypothetical protein